MITGARHGQPSRLRRLFAEAAARELSAFVVPGVEVVRARGLDPEAAGLRITGVPRHASVLLVVGEIPGGLRKAAAVVYSQMMRPRALLAAGSEELAPLPEADVSVDLSQGALDAGVAELRRSFAENAWRPDVETFEAEEVMPQEDEENGHGGHQHGGHEEMDHGGMDFMSMVEMTKDLPRSGDGLQMEWLEAPFGPLFPGLPGGLSLTLTLDGDTVAEAEVEVDLEGWISLEGLAGPVGSFAERLAGLDPLSPIAYRVLALRAVEDAVGVEIDEQTVRARVGALERERAASHLGWLSGFGHLIGYGWLSRRAAELQISLLGADVAKIADLQAEVRKLVRRVERTPLLRHRLVGIGPLRGDAEVSGPVARAGGSGTDARSEDEAYRALGFEPVVHEGDDALARLRVRLAEMENSLEISVAAGSISVPDGAAGDGASSTGAAAVETPRGTATLRVTLEGGEVVAVEPDTPSTRHLGLVGRITEQREVADALVGVASLDLSPWETVR